jgi:predicted DCC family thiol-disulfide oxidoreductase YuxK
VFFIVGAAMLIAMTATNTTAIAHGEFPAVVPESITVVFDGRCGMCTRSARLLARFDRRGAVEIAASQAPGVRDRFGLSVAETDAAAWAVTPDGVRVGGARAIGLALAVARHSRVPILAWRVPGMPWVLDRIYDMVARHRTWFPGDTPWCEDRDCT